MSVYGFPLPGLRGMTPPVQDPCRGEDALAGGIKGFLRHLDGCALDR